MLIASIYALCTQFLSTLPIKNGLKQDVWAYWDNGTTLTARIEKYNIIRIHCNICSNITRKRSYTESRKKNTYKAPFMAT